MPLRALGLAFAAVLLTAAPAQAALTATPNPVDFGEVPVGSTKQLEVVVKNAVDALSGRGGRIEVEVESADSMGRVSVRDDGPGVAPEMLHQLFEPGASSKTGGWGIGLALARRIVEQQHHGKVAFRPGPEGKGSVFVLEFPLTS